MIKNFFSPKKLQDGMFGELIQNGNGATSNWTGTVNFGPTQQQITLVFIDIHEMIHRSLKDFYNKIEDDYPVIEKNIIDKLFSSDTSLAYEEDFYAETPKFRLSSITLPSSKELRVQDFYWDIWGEVYNSSVAEKILVELHNWDIKQIYSRIGEQGT